MRSVLDDVRFGWRMLVRSPGFTAVAVATLALGVGLNCAIFSVVNSILLRPLPYRDSERLVVIDETHPRLGIEDPGVSRANFMDWRARNHVFEEMALVQGTAMNVTGGGEPERIRVAEVSASLFPLLRVWPAVGRAFGGEENVPGGGRSVVLSWKLWQRRFGGSPSAVGRTVVLSGRPYTVAGIMPAGFGLPEAVTDAWVLIEDARNRGSRGTAALAMLKPGVPLGRAQTEMDAIQQRLAAEYPENAGWKVKLSPARDQMVGVVRRPLLVLLGAVAFVLLIACANVANLLLARAPARRREIAVRTALGAGRARVVRQLMVESLLLGGLGGLAGVAAGRAALWLLVARLPEGIPRAQEIRMDAAALAFTLAAAVLTGLIFGAAPALEASQGDLASALKETGRGGAGGHRHRLRSLLVIGEVALSLVLLAGAGLLARSLLRLMRTDPGFAAEHVLTMRVDLPFTIYADTPRRTSFFTQVLEKVARIPQVQAAGVSDAVPFRMGSGWGIAIEGRPPLKPGEFNMAGVSRVSPGYLRAMGIRLLRGRGLAEADREGSPLVAVITETMAKRYWPDEDPVGKRFRPAGPKTPWFTVVGVAADVKHWSISRPPQPESFLSYLQDAPTDMALVLRTAGDPAAVAAEVRRAVHAVDPNQPVGRVETMAAIVKESLAPQRVSAALAGLFGALALGLALVGIYGVVACSVTERTREIGIRMALGAEPGGVRGMVLRQALVLVAAGMVLGTAGALALTRLLGSTLYEVRAADPAAFSAAAMAVLAAGAAAAWIPARRAAGLEPSLALRHE